MTLLNGENDANSISGRNLRYRELCEHLPVGVFVVDVRDYWTYANPAARALLGILPHETLAEAWSRYVHAEDRAMVTRKWREFELQPGEMILEYRCQLLDRPPTWVRSHAVPQFDEQGKLASYVGNLYDITEERRTTQNLREQERFFRTIFEQAGVGVGVLDSRTGRFIKVNQKYCDLVGYTPDELKVRTFQSLTHSDDLPNNLEQWHEMMTGRLRNLSMEKRYVRKDGVAVWVQLTITPVWAPGEPPDRHVTIVEDITQRKEAEQRLRQSEERFRLLCEHAPVGIFLTDAAGQNLYLNTRCSEIIGLQANEARGGGWATHLHPDDRARVPEKWHAAVATKSAYENESRYVHADGRLRRAHTTAIPTLNAAGEIVTWIGVVVDVTDQHEAHEALRASEEQYRELFQANTDALFFLSLDGRVVDVNPATCSLYGYSREEFLTIDPRVFVHPDSFHLFVDFLKKCRAGELFHAEAKNVRKDGTLFDIDVHGTRLVYRGQPHAFAIVRDITRRKAAEAEQRRQETMLAHVSRLSTMGEMVAGIAHEVNQPLYSIVNYAKAIGNVLSNDTSPASEELRGWNEEISAAATRAGEIVRKVRDFTSRKPVDVRPEDLHTVLRESLDLVQYELRRAKVKVDLSLADALPAVQIDRVQMQQVIVNLLKNAIDALDSRDERSRRIRLATLRDGERICVEVADNGHGLQPLHGGDPFAPFVTSKPEGMGMGLPISRTIVEAHGGTISATNNSWGGATFTFCIPVARSAH